MDEYDARILLGSVIHNASFVSISGQLSLSQSQTDSAKQLRLEKEY
jgi:hypothetical protein